MNRIQQRAACTIVSPNYFAYARTLCASYLRHHPDHRFFVLIVADVTDPTRFEADAFTPVLVNSIGVEDLRVQAMKYDILELNTNVKPTFLKHLLKTFALDQVVYLDPNIFVYAPLTPVFDALDAGASATLTPHMTTPVFDGKAPSEQDILYNGTYNLGFIGLSNSAESLRVLDWWERRCLDLGYSEGRTGLFVDQKWMNLAPGLFDRVAILRDAGLNMAYWNLHERRLSRGPQDYAVENPNSDAVLLRFFHFSGIVLADPAMLSKNTDRFTLAQRPDLQPLFADYKATVLANRKPEVEAIPYGFDRLSDGTSVTRLARRIYAMHHARWPGTDPFDSAQPFAYFAQSLNLVKGTVAPKKETWGDFNARDRRVEAIHALLRLTLRMIGPHKYELLMRYLAHIAVLRNQAVFLNDGAGPPPAK